METAHVRDVDNVITKSLVLYDIYIDTMFHQWDNSNSNTLPPSPVDTPEIYLVTAGSALASICGVADLTFDASKIILAERFIDYTKALLGGALHKWLPTQTTHTFDQFNELLARALRSVTPKRMR